MKRVSVPFIALLNEIPLDKAGVALEEKGSGLSVETLNWPEQFHYKPLTTVYVGRDTSAIYLYFQVLGNCRSSVHTQDNQPVHEDSCVDFFVQLPDHPYYYNFEFNCIGTCKAARHFRTREQAEDLSLLQLQQIRRWPSIGTRPFNEMDGLFSWDLCVSIPYQLIGIDGSQLPEKLRANFYKCADATEQPHYVSWNPIQAEKPDFHRPESFGELLLT
jgi:hypothetical protein